MGIPAFFSYILRKYSDIILKLDRPKHETTRHRLSFNFLSNKNLSFTKYYDDRQGHDGGGGGKDMRNKGISKPVSMKIENLYMDSNSIIYDEYNELVKLTQHYTQNPEKYEDLMNEITELGEGGAHDWLNSIEQFEDILIKRVIKQIEYYIHIIQPSNRVCVSFDGVSPLAKMEQQRKRRYKGMHSGKVFENFVGRTERKTALTSWSTSNITPGTPFMRKLSEQISAYFHGTAKKYKVKSLIISAAEEAGEGEHKIFNDIRNNNLTNENAAIYGLDADLIMLALLNPFCKNIFVFRETPSFLTTPPNTTTKVASVNKSDTFRKEQHPITESYKKTSSQTPIEYDTPTEPSELIFLNIEKLALSIMTELNGEPLKKPAQWSNTAPEFHFIQDYIFMCFFLGNDFMPRSISLNIRNNGIEKLVYLYKTLNYAKTFHFITTTQSSNIEWSLVKIFITKLAITEEEYILDEYNSRQKFDKYRWPTETQKDRENYINNIPIVERKDEKYIAPNLAKWQDRYYMALFLQRKTPANLKTICLNYLECIEWTYKYYCGAPINWRWRYNHNYSPLFYDLLKYIPDDKNIRNIEMLEGGGSGLFHKKKGRNQTTNEVSNLFYLKEDEVNNPFKSHTQLCLVLPPINHNLLDERTREIINTKYRKYYIYDYTDLTYQWAFCRYLWEAHLELPTVPLTVLNKWDELYE